MRKANMITLIISTSALAIATPAMAQSTPATTATAQSDNAGLEDIIVTAQRRPENIQDVSLSIQAVTAESLVKSGISDVTRVDLIAPGVTFARYGADSKISMRGANSNNTFLDSSPSVGVFVDGVYRPRAAQQTRAFFDVSRIEVLKGPQGTLYGRNTLAGAVNLWTNLPSTSGFGAGMTAQYARFNTVKGEGYINAPLSPNVAVRLAGLIERGDGYVKNLAGDDVGSPDTVSVRGSIRYAAPSGGDITLKVTNIRERGNVAGLFALTGTCRNVTAQGLTDPFGTILDCRNPRRGSAGSANFSTTDRLTIRKNFVHADKIDEFNMTLEANLPLSEQFNIKSISSFTNFKLDVGQDGDFSEIGHSYDFLRERVKSYTTEVQFSGDFDRLKFTAGGYLSRDAIDFLSASFRATRDVNTAATRPLVVVPNYPTFSLPVLNPTPLAGPTLDFGDPAVAGRGGQNSNNFQYTKTQSIGLFGQASVSILENLRIVGGVRYSRDNKSSEDYGGGRATTTLQGPQFPLAIPRTIDVYSIDRSFLTSRQKRSYSNTTYRGAVEYDISPDVLLYAQVATGFLSGSLSTAGTNTDDQKSINYEAGIKSRFLDNKVQFNASVFRTNYNNLITSFQRPNNSGGVDTVSSNGGNIKATGAEAVIDLRPVESFRLTLALSVLDSKFGTFNVLAPHQLVNGNPTTTGRFVNLSGVTSQFAPKFTGSVIAAYDIDLGDAGKITPQVQFYYSGRYSAQSQLSFIDPAGTQPAYSKTDLRIGWSSADERFGIDAYVENLEDEVINLRTTYGGDGIEQVTWGYPTNYGIRVRTKF
jgi:iron complex outermembrane recepter protein